MKVAYWEHPETKHQPAYIFHVNPVLKGRKGYWEYQATMAQISQVNAVLRQEGYKLRYREAE